MLLLLSEKDERIRLFYWEAIENSRMKARSDIASAVLKRIAPLAAKEYLLSKGLYFLKEFV